MAVSSSGAGASAEGLSDAGASAGTVSGANAGETYSGAPSGAEASAGKSAAGLSIDAASAPCPSSVGSEVSSSSDLQDFASADEADKNSSTYSQRLVAVYRVQVFGATFGTAAETEN